MEGGVSIPLKGNPLATICELEIGLAVVLYSLNSRCGSPRTLEDVADEARNAILKIMRDFQTHPAK